ncbi:YdbH family protein [Entomohabitans teleogrylli]|uniref:YdbH family protein n=1 Tax=Entomohabitans teleogrylli TaxID=1384589 RepID=UPI00073D51D6|nr:YdbH family protein [Entomohabitans teleogrylli]
MKGKYKAAIALLLIVILLPLALVVTLGYWLPGLAGLWLPQGTRIALDSSPRLSLRQVVFPDLRYLAGDCELAKVTDATLSRPSRWQLRVAKLTLNTDCFAQLPSGADDGTAPRTLAQWQSMLPRSWVRIDRLEIAPWQEYAGALNLALSEQRQQINYQGEKLTLEAQLHARALTIRTLNISLLAGQEPVSLAGDLTLPLVPDGLPVAGKVYGQLHIPQQPQLVDLELEWQRNRGQLIIGSPDTPDPLLDLPWTVSADRLEISDGRWSWPYEALPLSGRLGVRVDNWQQGLELAQISGRLNVLTQGDAGKGNAVLSFGPGKLSLTDSELPLQLSGEAKEQQLTFYATLFADLRGSLADPQLIFKPGSLLRSRGKVIDTLNIDEVRWPLAGVRVNQNGINGRLQAILRAHENQLGAFELHLDGQARDFLPDSGLWQWRYWGKGRFAPMQADWDVAGKGQWQDQTIELSALSTGFNRLQYGSMTVDSPRLALEAPLRWQRDAAQPLFSGALSLDAGETRFTGGSVLPPSTLKFSVQGRDPGFFQFKGALNADQIGPVRVHGRWDSERLRGEAWWPRQTLSVFQPLLPADWKMDLNDGTFYAQVAFSAAAGQGFEAGGHGVVKDGSVWMPDNSVSGVDFILPFRFSDGTWHLGTRGPVSLKVAEIRSQAVAKNLTLQLEGWYPWSESQPLLLSDVSVDVLGGRIRMQQLRMPQRDAALLRLENISSSELISAINPKQFTLSGRINGALPLWLDNPQWIIKDGWLTSPGPLTLRLDKDMADAIVRDNIAAGAAINWLRYMEISRSWTTINLDNLGMLTMTASLQGTSHVAGKSNTVKLNYRHQENLFMLWRSLRFGDNLQSWLEQHMALPGGRCLTAGEGCEEQK